ncbi:MAG: dynamin family protein [Planctomycetaceae bacterium]
MNDNVATVQDEDRERRIRARIAEIRLALNASQAREAAAEFAECDEALQRMRQKLDTIEEKLEVVPPIDVAVLGPSRHGKSTLLNSLISAELLPTSDTRPCTASIVKLTWAPEWAVHVTFVGKDQLMADWKSAVREATDALGHEEDGDAGTADEGAGYVRSVLQRFIQLFGISPDLPPRELIGAVRSGTIPSERTRLLGRREKAKANDVDGMKRVIEKYLSTSDVNWTIVEECVIAGPFENWHPSLSLIDLPGTNDTDPQRTAITNSMRENATAVAIVTSDSNIGPDIESWLRSSSVLANFLEATRQRRQRLFIIRTKLDSYHPKVPLAETDEEEQRLHFEAIEAYKREQTTTYHAMLRDIAGPKLPAESDEKSRQQRADLLSRMDEIQVFFVSALAHEVFCDRYQTSRKSERQMSDYFDGDVHATGVPRLREFLRSVAAEYLSENFFEDIEQNLESEVRLMAETFQKAIATTKAEIAGGQQDLLEIANTVRTQLIPWISQEIVDRTQTFEKLSLTGASGIVHRLQQAEAMSDRRLADKIRIWSGLHWASLRATARKGGVHVTSRGQCIDIGEDICSVLVDDVLLAWTHFRDHLISEQISLLTSDLALELTTRLQELRANSNISEVREAVEILGKQIVGITHQQRLALLAGVNDKIRQVESIRKPAYRIAQEEMKEVLAAVSQQYGTGCSNRMQSIVEDQTPVAIDRIRERVNALVKNVVEELAQSCRVAMEEFGNEAAQSIESAMSHVASSLIERDRETLKKHVLLISTAAKTLPAPQTST